MLKKKSFSKFPKYSLEAANLSDVDGGKDTSEEEGGNATTQFATKEPSIPAKSPEIALAGPSGGKASSSAKVANRRSVAKGT